VSLAGASSICSRSRHGRRVDRHGDDGDHPRAAGGDGRALRWVGNRRGSARRIAALRPVRLAFIVASRGDKRGPAGLALRGSSGAPAKRPGSADAPGQIPDAFNAARLAMATTPTIRARAARLGRLRLMSKSRIRSGIQRSWPRPGQRTGDRGLAFTLRRLVVGRCRRMLNSCWPSLRMSLDLSGRGLYDADRTKRAIACRVRPAIQPEPRPHEDAAIFERCRVRAGPRG